MKKDFDITDLLDRTDNQLQAFNYRDKTRKFYLDWIYRFLYYFEDKSPPKFTENDLDEFISFLKTDCQVASSTIKQAETAIHFFYREVIQIPILRQGKSARKQAELPVILSREEIKDVLQHLQDELWLITGLLYGCGLKLKEALQLRLQHIDLDQLKITIHDSYGNGSRSLCLPKSMAPQLNIQLKNALSQHEENFKNGNYIGTVLPDFERTSPSWPGISKAEEWQYLFPSKALRRYKNTDRLIQGQISESHVQKKHKEVFSLCGISPQTSSHSFRHSFATHLIENGYDIHLVQKILGHKCLQSTAIYRKLANPGQPDILTPLDELLIPRK